MEHGLFLNFYISIILFAPNSGLPANRCCPVRPPPPRPPHDGHRPGMVDSDSASVLQTAVWDTSLSPAAFVARVEKWYSVALCRSSWIKQTALTRDVPRPYFRSSPGVLNVITCWRHQNVTVDILQRKYRRQQVRDAQWLHCTVNGRDCLYRSVWNLTRQIYYNRSSLLKIETKRCFLTQICLGRIPNIVSTNLSHTKMSSIGNFARSITSS